MTRVALLNPDIWTDLFFDNRVALLEALDGLMARLGEYRAALAEKDTAKMHELLAQGRDARLAEMCNFVKEQDPRYCCVVKVEQSYASALPEEDQ